MRRAARMEEHDRPDGAHVYVPLSEGYALEKTMPGHRRAMRMLEPPRPSFIEACIADARQYAGDDPADIVEFLNSTGVPCRLLADGTIWQVD